MKDGQKRCWDRRMKKGFRWVAGGSAHAQEVVSTAKDDCGTVERHALE